MVGARPLRFTNDLLDLSLVLEEPGLTLSGTNQRFGATGELRVVSEGKLQLGNREFEIREGRVRFDDPTKVAPKVDVRATTEYRRYAESTANGAAATTAATAASSAGSTTAGQWRITLRVQGDVDDLRVDFTSDPPLSQEDIVLLLTMGMTRAEVDRSLASSLGQTVGFEALNQLTGANQAMRSLIPILDEFRFGTGYSSRTGRTEPTVTVGKRVADRLRANVTTGLTENREVRSSLEWKLGRRTSLQGVYDNVNDVSSSSLGNVGADLRFRLEFE